jgi:hypothetical protein
MVDFVIRIREIGALVIIGGVIVAIQIQNYKIRNKRIRFLFIYFVCLFA